MVKNFPLALTIALLPAAIPVVVGGLCALLSWWRPPRRRPDLYRWVACIALAGAVAAAGIALFGMRLNKNGVALTVWNGGLVVDHFSLFIAVTAAAFGLITCLVSDTYVRRIPERSGAFFALLLVGVGATIALAAERELVTMFVPLETLLVCLTGITALVKISERGSESAIRYVIEGGVASAALLYGFALLYGVTGSTNLS